MTPKHSRPILEEQSSGATFSAQAIRLGQLSRAARFLLLLWVAFLEARTRPDIGWSASSSRHFRIERPFPAEPTPSRSLLDSLLLQCMNDVLPRSLGDRVAAVGV